MKKVVTETEILDFAEGMPLDREVEESLVSILSASAEFRRNLDDYRRDLSASDQGIPQIQLTLDIARELPGIAKKALQNRYKEIFAPGKFFRSREVLLVAGFLMAMLVIVVAYLKIWAWKN